MKNIGLLYLFIIGIIYGFNNDSNVNENYILIDKLQDSSEWKKSPNSYFDSFFSKSNCSYLKYSRFEATYDKDFTVKINNNVVRLYATKLELMNDSVSRSFFHNLKLSLTHDTIRGRPHDFYCLHPKMVFWPINIRLKNSVYLVDIYDKTEYFKKGKEIVAIARKEFGDENVFSFRFK